MWHHLGLTQVSALSGGRSEQHLQVLRSSLQLQPTMHGSEYGSVMTPFCRCTTACTCFKHLIVSATSTWLDYNSSLETSSQKTKIDFFFVQSAMSSKETYGEYLISELQFVRCAPP